MANAYSQRLTELKSRPSCKLKEIGDQWRTPAELYWGINAKFWPFTLDLFTDGDNSKCRNFYTAENNALLQDWTGDLKKLGGSAFANPPYSRASQDDDSNYVTGMRHIIDKTIKERDAGARIVFLIKSATSEVWWPEEADHIAFIRGRISFDVPEWFVPEEGTAAESGAGFASAVAIFDSKWRGDRMSYISREALEGLGGDILSMIADQAATLVALSEPKLAISEPDLPVSEPELAISEPESAIFEPEIEEAIKQDDVLPTHIADITDLRVRAALAAAFGEKEVYSFSESKFAHTWIADSFEFPTIITVSSEVIARAIATSQRHQITELINNSGCTGPQVDRLNALLEFVSAVYSEWFIPIMRELIERVKANAVENIREMRNIADSVIHEFLCDPITAIKSAGLAVAQVDALCAVLSDIDAGDFGEFDRADLMPALNKLVGYVRSRNIDNARYMRIYLRKYTVINGTVAA
ncbi:MAG: phage N-6-adenine-methyltransferase [Plesiomonas sp.]